MYICFHITQALQINVSTEVKEEMREIWHGPILMIVKQDSEGNDYLAVTNCKNDASKLNLPRMVKVDGKELEVKSISVLHPSHWTLNRTIAQH